MSQIAVSVTVPVYNTSKYLRKCLESLKAQTLDNIEFILVDDGSTDGSGAICDEYAKEDSRFKVIHQKNGGLAVARQTGLDSAIGEYIIVCDSDDWVEPDMYAKLYAKALSTKADIVMCQFFLEYPTGESKPHINIFNNLTGIDFIKEMMRSSINNSSWVKLIRRNLFIKGNISYEPGINLGEDCLMIYKILQLNPQIEQIPDVLYHYRRDSNSQSYTNSLKMTHIYQTAFVHNWLKENYDNDIYSRELYYKSINHAFSCLRVQDLDYYYLKKNLSNLTWKNFFKYGISLKILLVYSCKIFPISITRWGFGKLYPYFYR